MTPTWLIGLLVFVVIALIASRLAGRTTSHSVGHAPTGHELSPEGGNQQGPLSDYFDKIRELDSGGYDGFFVTVTDPASGKFVQVSAGAPPDGNWGYQFDLPLNDWAKPHFDEIEAEAHRRGLEPVQSKSGPMRFLDIDFTDRDAHEDFARWGLTGPLAVPEGTRYDITWG